MDVSIIVVSYNTRRLLRECLGSIFLNTRNVRYEVIVVDNGSADGSADMVEREFADACLIRLATNTGFGAANNVGYRRSSGRYVFLLNSDTCLLDDAVGVFVQFMERPENQDVAVCGGMLVDKDGGAAVSCGNLPSVLDLLVWLFRLDVILPQGIKARLSPALRAEGETAYPMPLISGAAFFLRRSALAEPVPFDTDFFLYFEETELCFRLRKRGFRGMVIPTVRIMHLYSQTAVSLGDKRAEIFERSKLLYFLKCKGPRTAGAVRALYCIGYLCRYLLAARETDRQKMKFYWTRGLMKTLSADRSSSA